MALLPKNLDYTDKDFASIRARLFNLIPQVFPDWTDRDVADFGNLLVELFAYVMDVLGFYQDNQAKESRLSDAQLRRSVLAIAKQLNYVPEGNAAATANVLVTLSTVPTSNVLLQAGRIYQTAEVTNRVEFQQLFDVTIPAGLDPPQTFVSVENSEDNEETLSSNGLPTQEFGLVGIPYLDTSLVLTATNGAYTQVSNFLDSTATDRHYTVTVDENGRALVRFGNGVNGEIPSGAITAFYKTGGGKAGNVDENSITRIVGSLTDVNGTRVQAIATNPSAASGGADRETIESIKQKAPPSTKITDRTVSLDDYEVGAVNVTGVARALMITADEVVGVPENRGFLYVVPDGGGIPTDTLKAAVLQAVTVTRPSTITFKVTVESPTYLAVDVSAAVFFADGFSQRAVATAINTALSEYFQISTAAGVANERVKFGLKYGSDMTLPMSDLFSVVEGVSGVRKIGANDLSFLLNLSHADVPLQYYEFPVLGTVTITDGDTGSVVEPL
jgi:phage-related baseplate assembly protein